VKGKEMLYLEPAAEFNSTSVLLYAKGLSEPLRRCLQQQGKALFSRPTRHLGHI